MRPRSALAALYDSAWKSVQSDPQRALAEYDAWLASLDPGVRRIPSHD